MPSQKHEDMLLIAIEKFIETGYRVIRLDKSRIPDAFAIDWENKKVIAIEASTSPVNHYFIRKKLEEYGSQYDEEVIITDQYSDRYYPKEAYLLALKLRKEGKTYKEIADEIEKVFNKRPAKSTLHDWITGEKAPPSIPKIYKQV